MVERDSKRKRRITNRKNNKCAKPLLPFALDDKLTITIFNRIENKKKDQSRSLRL